MSAIRKRVVPCAALVGLVTGFISVHTLFAGSWTALIFWGILGFSVGALGTSSRQSLMAGVTFGVLLTITFLLAGFKGAQSEFGRFMALSLALGVLGGICGLVLAGFGYWAKNRLSSSTSSG